MKAVQSRQPSPSGPAGPSGPGKVWGNVSAIADIALRGRDFINEADFTAAELHYILVKARNMKQQERSGIKHRLLADQTLAMIFAKPSTRTRVSFEVGMYQLGGGSLFLSSHELQLGRGETIADTAQVLSRYVDGIMIRTFSHDDVVELGRYADVPVINGLTDLRHPCQAMADLLTIMEHKGDLDGLVLTYVGDGNNVANSLLTAASMLGMQVRVAAPRGYEPDSEIVAAAQKTAGGRGEVSIVRNPKEAAAGADVVYTDVWASMGKESEAADRGNAFAEFSVDEQLLGLAKADAVFMHCLPAQRGREVSAGVIDGPQSVVFDQAENRLHAQKAIMALLMAK
ncbi:MAG: ornithine carbamoyltransferase [Thermaerobacterales bacterium]